MNIKNLQSGDGEQNQIFSLALKIVSKTDSKSRLEPHIQVLDKATQHISFFQSLKRNYPPSFLRLCLRSLRYLQLPPDTGLYTHLKDSSSNRFYFILQGN